MQEMLAARMSVQSGAARHLQAQLRRHVTSSGSESRLHLAHHLAAVRLDRDLADAELAADLLVQPTADHERHDLALAAASATHSAPAAPAAPIADDRGTAAFDAPDGWRRAARRR